MARDTLAERDSTFNQLSASSRSRAGFHSSERIAKLEWVAMLLAQADALSSVALRDAFHESTSSERHHFLAALNELIETSREQLDDVLASSRHHKVEE